MLTPLRKNSTLLIVAPVPACALTTKFIVEKLRIRLPLPGVSPERIGGVPTTLATVRLTTPEVAVKELVSVTRTVRRRAPRFAAVGVHANVVLKVGTSEPAAGERVPTC